MSEPCQYVIRLIVEDRYGRNSYQMATDTDEFPFFSERFVEDVRAPIDAGFSVLSFDEVVSVLKERKFRREMLLIAAKRLAERLADYIEDAEGWHGESRREAIKERRKEPRP
jgi:hypothetical protein